MAPKKYGHNTFTPIRLPMFESHSCYGLDITQLFSLNFFHNGSYRKITGGATISYGTIRILCLVVLIATKPTVWRRYDPICLRKLFRVRCDVPFLSSAKGRVWTHNPFAIKPLKTLGFVDVSLSARPADRSANH